jgi:hypothetical protein
MIAYRWSTCPERASDPVSDQRISNGSEIDAVSNTDP